MGRAGARRAAYEEKDPFEEGHIPLVWDELHDRFGVNTNVWKEKFNKAFMEEPHSTTKLAFFRKYMQHHFNDELNHLLCRPSMHNTIYYLMDYVAKKGIR